LSSMAHYFITHTSAGVQIHQFSNIFVNAELEQAGKVAFEVNSEYPWKGDLAIAIQESGHAPWQLSIRIPGWCQSFTVKVNGKTVFVKAKAHGYLHLTRPWKAGDNIHLRLEMEPQFIVSHPRVDATRGCVALQRGPLVYCFESLDQPPGIDLLDIQVDSARPVQAEWADDLLGGVMVLHPQGYVLSQEPWEGALYLPLDRTSPAEKTPISLRAIPYYAWGNRGLRSMRVWVPFSTDARR